jgi:peptide/nickel transport system ATP-binding protein
MPYTRDLIARVPGAGERPAAPATPPAPAPLEVAPGGDACLYVSQCALRQEVCAERVPPLARVEPDHLVRCWFPVGHEPLDQADGSDAQAVATTPRKGA